MADARNLTDQDVSALADTLATNLQNAHQATAGDVAALGAALVDRANPPPDEPAPSPAPDPEPAPSEEPEAPTENTGVTFAAPGGAVTLVPVAPEEPAEAPAEPVDPTPTPEPEPASAEPSESSGGSATSADLDELATALRLVPTDDVRSNIAQWLTAHGVTVA